MRTLKTLLTVAATAVSIGAFADAANTLITFSTPGPDTYADDSKVLDGERYALVWSQNGAFDGFNVDGTPVDKNDKVFCIASLAKEGKCPTTIFQIDSKVAPADGVYAVYLLDTRVTTTDLASSVTVAGATVAKTYDAKGGTDNIASTAKVDSSADGLTSTTRAVALDQATAQKVAPKIDSIKVEGATVTISVSNLMPGLKYSVTGGLDRSPLNNNTLVDGVGFGSAMSGNIVIQNSGETFFSIKAE